MFEIDDFESDFNKKILKLYSLYDFDMDKFAPIMEELLKIMENYLDKKIKEKEK